MRIPLLIVAVAVVVLCLICSANAHEPALVGKQLMLNTLYAHCPWIQEQVPSHPEQLAVVKPDYATSRGFGVGIGSAHWTTSSCSGSLGVECFAQPFNSAPYEARLVRHGWMGWDPTVVFNASDSRVTAVSEFWFESALKACLEGAFRGTPFLAVDIVTDGNSFTVCEINGVWGLPLLATVTNNLVRDLVRWAVPRIFSSVRANVLQRMFNVSAYLLQRGRIALALQKNKTTVPQWDR